MSIPAIELKNVSVQFSGEIILKNISLKVQPQSRVALIGPSGQGKSVLLKIMATLIKPTQGEVYIKSQSWTSLPLVEQQRYLRKMGMLFQKNALFDSLSISENVAFPLRETTLLSEAEIQERVAFFLEAVGISHAKDLFPDEISGGMQKRLGIARALALDPEVIFYDDPTAGLDPITSRKIIDLILDLQKKRKSTVVAVTNDMNRAFQMADQIAMVVGGEVLLTGTVAETKAHPDARVQQFIHARLEGPLTVKSEAEV